MHVLCLYIHVTNVFLKKETEMTKEGTVVANKIV